MSLIRRVSLLMLLVVVLALVGGVVTTLIAARDTLQAQLGVKNRDNAQALALALSQQRGDAALMELVLAAQFDTGHYRRISGSAPTAARCSGARRMRSDQGAGLVRAGVAVHAEPGVAQVSDGWRPIGHIELVSQSAYASDALWRAGVRAAELLALVGLLGGLWRPGVCVRSADRWTPPPSKRRRCRKDASSPCPNPSVAELESAGPHHEHDGRSPAHDVRRTGAAGRGVAPTGAERLADRAAQPAPRSCSRRSSAWSLRRAGARLAATGACVISKASTGAAGMPR